MINDFITKKLKTAKYKILEDGGFYGEIPSIKGVWADAKNLEDCRQELSEVIEEWLLLKVKDQEPIPGFRLPLNLERL